MFNHYKQLIKEKEGQIEKKSNEIRFLENENLRLRNEKEAFERQNEYLEDKNKDMADTIKHIVEDMTHLINQTFGENPNIECVFYKTYRDAPIIFKDGQKIDATRASGITIRCDVGERVQISTDK